MPNDILLTSVGTLGVPYLVAPGEEFYFKDGNLTWFRRFSDVIDPRYLLYWMKSPVGQSEFDKITIGSTQKALTIIQLKKLRILVPKRREQSKIVEVIASLDDKIELNRRMNETLETMAQAIFRDWFVDFGPTRRKMDGAADPVQILGGLVSEPERARELAELFPAQLGDNGLPEGWRFMLLSDVADQSTATVNPQKSPNVVFEHYSLPAYDSGQAPSRDLGATIKSNKVRVLSGSILVSKLNPETPRVWLPNDDSGLLQVSSTEFLMFTPKSGLGRGLLYFMFQDASVRQIMEGMVTGTSKSHQRISPPALLKTELLVGTVNVFVAFETLVAPILLRLLALRHENHTLAATRDLLLPKLMSGEIRLREAERQIEEVA